MPDLDPPPATPLETFVRDYLETSGGVWDEVEPQVYDVLLPSAEILADGTNLVRLAFDPEALPEHPGAQLASYGTPLIDRLLDDALRRGRSAHFYYIGLNLVPHNLPARVARSLTLTPPLEMEVQRTRALHFTQAVYWFRAEFVSDQKEQTILPMAIDLHHGREVRHLEQLLEASRLGREPAQPLPEARRLSVAAGHVVAREHVLRTLTAFANVRARQLTERRDRQTVRMTRYYADLRDELDELAHRGKPTPESLARLEQRRSAIDREEQVRIAELRQKSSLRVSLRLMQVLRIDQPKLLLHALFRAEKLPPLRLELVWDPLTEALEALVCPTCQRPTFALEPGRGRLHCPACVPKDAGRKK